MERILNPVHTEHESSAMNAHPHDPVGQEDEGSYPGCTC